MDDSPYLIGWKAIAKYIGNIHWQTVRYWHHTKLHLPYVKSAPSQQGRPIIAKVVVDAWARELGKTSKPGKS